MSWAAHNPEKYEEFIQAGVARYLCRMADKAGFAYPGDVFDMMAEVLLAVEPHREAFIQAASNQITEAEQDYFGGLVDQAKERFDDAV